MSLEILSDVETLLTRAKILILMALHRYGPMPPSRISMYTLLPRTTVFRALAFLQDKGLVCKDEYGNYLLSELGEKAVILIRDLVLLINRGKGICRR